MLPDRTGLRAQCTQPWNGRIARAWLGSIADFWSLGVHMGRATLTSASCRQILNAALAPGPTKALAL
jgi:hypothetical protein